MIQNTSNSIRLVIFDLGNVVFPFDHAKILRRLERDSPLSSVQIISKYLHSRLGPLFDEGRVTPEDFFDSLKDLIGLSIDFKAFRECWNSMFLLNESVADLIRRLGNNYKVFVLSDTNKLHFEYLISRYRIFDYINKCILSFREGVRKPDPWIFERALTEAGVRPQEALFIDDMARNVRAAREIGLQAIQYSSVPKLEKELTRLDICVN